MYIKENRAETVILGPGAPLDMIGSRQIHRVIRRSRRADFPIEALVVVQVR